MTDDTIRELRALRTPQPRFEDGRPNPNGYEGGWHDAIEEVIGVIERTDTLSASRAAGLDVERLARAMRARLVGEVSDEAWDAEFNWHRDENNETKALAAAPSILARWLATGSEAAPTGRGGMIERHFRAWMADDGYHVEFSHPCDPPENNVRGTLPYPTWRAESGRLVPSINCGRCGLHEFVEIGEKPLLLQAVDLATGSEAAPDPEASRRADEMEDGLS